MKKLLQTIRYKQYFIQITQAPPARPTQKTHLSVHSKPDGTVTCHAKAVAFPNHHPKPQSQRCTDKAKLATTTQPFQSQNEHFGTCFPTPTIHVTATTKQVNGINPYKLTIVAWPQCGISQHSKNF